MSFPSLIASQKIIPSIDKEFYDRIKSLVSVNEFYEILAIMGEFSNVNVFTFGGARILSFETKVSIEHNNRLYVFGILRCECNMDSPNYAPKVYDPKNISRGYVHPHTSHQGYLCLGNGYRIYEMAGRDRRFYDMAIIVKQILHTYNAGSPYTRIHHFSNNGICKSCLESSEFIRCQKCNTDTCQKCLIPIRSQIALKPETIQVCESCYSQHKVCAQCQQKFIGPGVKFCSDCRAIAKKRL